LKVRRVLPDRYSLGRCQKRKAEVDWDGSFQVVKRLGEDRRDLNNQFAAMAAQRLLSDNYKKTWACRLQWLTRMDEGSMKDACGLAILQEVHNELMSIDDLYFVINV
jgi:hypothetical protein